MSFHLEAQAHVLLRHYGVDAKGFHVRRTMPPQNNSLRPRVEGWWDDRVRPEYKGIIYDLGENEQSMRKRIPELCLLNGLPHMEDPKPAAAPKPKEAEIKLPVNPPKSRRRQRLPTKAQWDQHIENLKTKADPISLAALAIIQRNKPWERAS